MGITVPFLVAWPDATLRSVLRPPKYGADLYDAIRGTKAVLNNFTDLSVKFHSNMRIFESIGNGALLISPRGRHPDGIEEGLDYLAFGNMEELRQTIARAAAAPEEIAAFAEGAQTRLFENFGKGKQYNHFIEFIENF
jgi:hypothetical protein